MNLQIPPIYWLGELMDRGYFFACFDFTDEEVKQQFQQHSPLDNLKV